MKASPAIASLFVSLAFSTSVQAGGPDEEMTWAQWGGTNRSFQFDADLAQEWPDDGPPVLWSREFGDGYSGMVLDQDLLFTMYRKSLTDGKEYIVALDKDNGDTIWEHALDAPLGIMADRSGWGGYGPNSTPALAGDRLLVISTHAVLLCLDSESGNVLWEHDLHEEYHAPYTRGGGMGFCASPLLDGETLIVPAGCDRIDDHEGEHDGMSLLAFDISDGELLWGSSVFEQGGASPIMIDTLGRKQIVVSSNQGLLGFDASDGEKLWSHDQSGGITSPVWNGDDLVFYASGGTGAPSLVVQLEADGDGIAAERIWGLNWDVKIWQSTPSYEDGVLYGSTGSDFVCMDIATGETLWSEEGYPLALGLRDEDQMVLLDEDGWLSLVTATPLEFKEQARFQVAEHQAYTAPAMLGSTLFVRDRKSIQAIDLGPQRG